MKWVKILLAIVGIKIRINDVVSAPQSADPARRPVAVMNFGAKRRPLASTSAIHMRGFRSFLVNY